MNHVSCDSLLVKGHSSLIYGPDLSSLTTGVSRMADRWYSDPLDFGSKIGKLISGDYDTRVSFSILKFDETLGVATVTLSIGERTDSHMVLPILVKVDLEVIRMKELFHTPQSSGTRTSTRYAVLCQTQDTFFVGI